MLLRGIILYIVPVPRYKGSSPKIELLNITIPFNESRMATLPIRFIS